MMVVEVFNVVREINAQGVAVVVVGHNIHHALAVLSRPYVFETGHVVAHHDSASLLKDEQLLHAYLGG